MRTNLPVVDEEFVLDNLQSIVSKTDLKGRIVYVNPYFIEVSGFTHDELLGAPHNLVRHPDMPAAAFADLWSTLRAGLPWNGLVKNRRKDGRYYWVMANVTPLLEQGRAVGYVSVRTKPSSDQVQAAQALYARLASGSCALHRGQMVRTGLAGRFDALLAMAPARRLDLGMAALLVLLIGSSAPVSQLLLERQAPGLAASVLTAAGVVLIVSLWRSLHAGVVEPGQQAVDALNGLAGGDLAAGNDGEHGNISHLQRALRQLKVNLRSIIGDVRANVNAINQVASEIACGNANLYQRTESQASNLQQTASTMEQFASTLRQNADSVMQAEQLVRAASDVAGQGGEVVARVGVRMGEINASATKIVDIIALIDSIAFQTNILALNAAVEAARAGEQGRGFAVVASEVRNLAQRSAAAAREIKSLIVASVDIIGSGNALVEQAGNTMDQVVQSVGRATDIMREIAIATAEQSSAIGQVSSAIGHMDELTQKNAVLVEQSAAAAKSLEAQTQGLVEAISLFKLDHPAGAGRRARA